MYSVDEVKQTSLTNEVPIIYDETKSILIDTVKTLQPKRILEIGGGMGYSAIVILSAAAPHCFVSIEKNEERYKYLKKVLTQFGATTICGDAGEILQTFNNSNETHKAHSSLPPGLYKKAHYPLPPVPDKYDFVFVDGAKAQYGRYFDYIDKLLDIGGTIFADNINFHGMVNGDTPATKGAKTIIAGLKLFVKKLEEHKYKIKRLPDGDGIIIAIKTI
jgi:predicted O-methyltransferase YrrM